MWLSWLPFLTHYSQSDTALLPTQNGYTSLPSSDEEDVNFSLDVNEDDNSDIEEQGKASMQ